MSTQIPNTETTTPDYLLGVERGHMVRVPVSASQPNDSQSVATLSSAAIAAGATGVAGVTAGGGLVKPDGTAISTGGGGSTVTLSDTYAIAGYSVPTSGNGAIVAANYARTRAKLAAVAAGTSNMTILRIGDSTECGANANGTGAPWTNVRSMSPTPWMALSLNSLKWPAYSESFFGDQNTAGSGVAVSTYDPRITLGVGWAASTTVSVKTLGACPISNTTTTNPLAFLPHEEVDTFVVYYMKSTGLGTFNLSRTGDATSGTIDTASASPAIGTVTFTGALGGANALNINRVAGNIFIIGVLAYNSAKKTINVINAGWSGGRSTDWASSANAWSYLPAAVAVQPDLTIISAGINDWVLATGVSTFQTNLQTIISALAPTSDIILRTGYASAKSSITRAVQKQYIDAVYSVAGTNGLIVQDYWTKCGTQENGVLAGEWADALHPKYSLLRKTAETDALLLASLA